MERTRSDSRYRPIRKSVSRYGKLEKALLEVKEEKEKIGGEQSFSPNDVAKHTRCLDSKTVSHLFVFTSGIKLVGKRKYIFDGTPIKVMFDE